MRIFTRLAAPAMVAVLWSLSVVLAGAALDAGAAVRARPAVAAALPGPAISVNGGAVASWGSGRMDLFTRGPDNSLRHQVFVPGTLATWSGTELLGGTLTSQPAAVAQATGRLDVFVRGSDGAVWQRSYNGSWSSWRSLGGTITSPPAVASWASGRLDLVARGGDGRLWLRAYNGTWAPWHALDGVVASGPAFTSRRSGSLDLFARATSGAVLYRSYSSTSGWSAWVSLGGKVIEEPGAASAASTELDVVARGLDSAVWTRHLSSSGWSAWSSLGGKLSSGASLARTDPGSLALFGRGTDGRYWYRQRASGSWSAWRAVDPAAAVRGLATWVDVFDYQALTPSTAVDDMAAQHVRTLFLETARFDSSADILYPDLVGDWIEAAHAAGIRVIGWYPPDYSDLTRDVNRTLAISRYTSPAGQRFDAIGIDIEYPLDVADPAAWNRAVTSHLARVRAGTMLPIVTIPLPPLLMAAWPNTSRWAGFPWSTMKTYADAVVPQGYWTSYTPSHRCPDDPQYCAYQYTRDNTTRTRSLTALPVHIAGGVGDAATLQQVTDYVRGAHDGQAVGGSLYDYRTTASSFWAQLQLLN